jgi:phytoene dehydrogenase-like protein
MSIYLAFKSYNNTPHRVIALVLDHHLIAGRDGTFVLRDKAGGVGALTERLVTALENHARENRKQPRKKGKP